MLFETGIKLMLIPSLYRTTAHQALGSLVKDHPGASDTNGWNMCMISGGISDTKKTCILVFVSCMLICSVGRWYDKMM